MYDDLASLPDWLARKRRISVKEAAALNAISEDTFRRHYRHLIKKVSPRRQVVELSDALAIGEFQNWTPTRLITERQKS